jgi:hypothetical protein
MKDERKKMKSGVVFFIGRFALLFLALPFLAGRLTGSKSLATDFTDFH